MAEIVGVAETLDEDEDVEVVERLVEVCEVELVLLVDAESVSPAAL